MNYTFCKIKIIYSLNLLYYYLWNIIKYLWKINNFYTKVSIVFDYDKSILWNYQIIIQTTV